MISNIYIHKYLLTIKTDIIILSKHIVFFEGNDIFIERNLRVYRRALFHLLSNKEVGNNQELKGYVKATKPRGLHVKCK